MIKLLWNVTDALGAIFSTLDGFGDLVRLPGRVQKLLSRGMLAEWTRYFEDGSGV